MITILAQFKLKEESREEAEKALSEMVEAVQAKESGALTYIMNRSRREPTEITVFEVYEDGDAVSAHNASAHMAKLQSALSKVADLSTVKIQSLERIAGFTRESA
jgi:quinol monooxygenase YgiN